MCFSDHVFDLRKRPRTFFDECPYCHGRTRTILHSSKLKPSQIRRLVSMLSDGAALRQAAHQAHVSLQTALLWKRKMQRIPENAGNTVLSGEVWVDHT